MTAWEYRYEDMRRWSHGEPIPLTTAASVPSLIRDMGTSGWELVTVENGVGFFKRPLPESTEDKAMGVISGQESSSPAAVLMQALTEIVARALQ